jgi:energy-converting hydrogenase Eha subunit B
MTHPGVGPLTALAFVLIIGSPERFRCGKQIGSYVGLIPCEDSSAGRQRFGHISKQGGGEWWGALPAVLCSLSADILLVDGGSSGTVGQQSIRVILAGISASINDEGPNTFGPSISASVRGFLLPQTKKPGQQCDRQWCRGARACARAVQGRGFA